MGGLQSPVGTVKTANGPAEVLTGYTVEAWPERLDSGITEAQSREARWGRALLGPAQDRVHS